MWYRMPEQSDYDEFKGKIKPDAIGRTLDNDTTQICQFAYVDDDYLTEVTDPKGRKTQYNYHPEPAPAGRQLASIKQKIAGGLWNTIAQFPTYNNLDQPLSTIDAAGETAAYQYDNIGRTTSVDRRRTVSGVSQVERMKYVYAPVSGAFGKVTQIVAQRFPGTLPVDPGAQPAEESVRASFTYDSWGRLLTATNADGVVLTYTHDALDRPVKTTYPDGTYEQTIYNKLDAEWQRDRAGRWTRIRHDAQRGREKGVSAKKGSEREKRKRGQENILAPGSDELVDLPRCHGKCESNTKVRPTTCSAGETGAKRSLPTMRIGTGKRG